MNTVLFVPFFAISSVLVALIFTYVMGRVDARNGAAKPARTTSNDLRALMSMTEDERRDEQRKLIVDSARTFPVEFFATVNTSSVLAMNYSEYTARSMFGREVEKALRGWFPLGGKLHVLPYSSSRDSRLRCVAYLETRHAVDAHEIATAACSHVEATILGKGMFTQVAFLPVTMPDPPQAGNKPGAWEVSFTYEVDPKITYGHVVTRTGDTDNADSEKTAMRSEWGTARDALLRVTREFAEFEFSPMDVALTRRLLWDLTEPATARFYEAFDAANMLLTDNAPSDTDTVTAFVEASRVAVAAWKSADRNARNKAEQNIVTGGAVLSSSAVKHRDTAASALRLALDDSIPAPEAGLAWRRATEALSRAGMEIPPSWQKKMESTEVVSRALKALPAGEAK